MAIPILPSTLTNGTTGDADEVMADLNAIVAQMTGNLDRNNYKDGEVITSKIADGAVTGPKLDPAVLAALGLNDGTAVRRGKSIIAASESRTNTGYGFLTTPDRVANVVVPANGIVRILFSALCSSTVGGQAAIFLGPNQQKVHVLENAAPQVEAANILGGGNFLPVISSAIGLVAGFNNANALKVTTGEAIGIASTHTSNGFLFSWGGVNQEVGGSQQPEAVGGACEIRGLPAGTYDVSVQFRSALGTVSAKERELYVEAVGF